MARSIARLFERVVDDEQAGEEDEELPVDQTEHRARVHLAAAEQDAGAGQGGQRVGGRAEAANPPRYIDAITIQMTARPRRAGTPASSR
jgi:hypothetical protein